MTSLERRDGWIRIKKKATFNPRNPHYENPVTKKRVSYTQIGKYLNRDHSTIIHARKSYRADRKRYRGWMRWADKRRVR